MESEKRNRAEVRRGDSIVPRWSGDRPLSGGHPPRLAVPLLLRAENVEAQKGRHRYSVHPLSLSSSVPLAYTLDETASAVHAVGSDRKNSPKSADRNRILSDDLPPSAHPEVSLPLARAWRHVIFTTLVKP